MSGSDFDQQTADAQSDFNDSYNDAQDTFNKTATTISTGWIIGIVVIAVAFLASVVTVLIFLRRRSKRRGQYQQFNQMVNSPSNGYNSQSHNMTTYDPHQPPSTYHQPQPYNPYPEVHGSNPPQRYEANDTGLREAPDTSFTKSPEPTHNTGPPAELAGYYSANR
ncbi:hypothetical protein F5Y18DRAFT_245862 [Xylariaceae sp. FL1019]|nr:hypothetical protein F5Y18DRAFT_245862 [Xylariaceae sp. FL1019]